MKKLAIITENEKNSPVFRALFPDIFTEFHRILTIADLRQMSTSRFAVNRLLGPHFQLLEAAKPYDSVLATAYCGLPSYLMQSFRGRIKVFAFDMLGVQLPLGRLMSEAEITWLELEEQLLADHPERFDFRSVNSKIYLDHYYGNQPTANPLAQQSALPDGLGPKPFIYLPNGRLAHTNGIRITGAEYVTWATAHKRPDVLKNADLQKMILVDEGNDHLELGNRLMARRCVGASLLAINEKRPVRRCYKGQIAAYGNAEWLRQLHQNSGQCYAGQGEIAHYCVKFGPDKPQKPSVSVVLVHHNRPQFLRSCLKGFSQQTYRNFQIILVDNGSSCLPEISDFIDLDITLVRNLNTFPGYARNLGAELALGEYVVFFDDDNIPKPEMLSSMLSTIREGPGDMVSCFREVFRSDPGKAEQSILSWPRLNHANLLRNFQGDVVFMMKRSKFLSLRFTDYYAVGREDVEFALASRAMGFTHQLIAQALYLYRLGNHDKIGNRHLTHRTGEHIDFDYGSFRKYRRARQSYAGAKLCQLTENYHVRQRAPKRHNQARLRLLAFLRQKLSARPLVRRVYHKWLRVR